MSMFLQWVRTDMLAWLASAQRALLDQELNPYLSKGQVLKRAEMFQKEYASTHNPVE